MFFSAFILAVVTIIYFVIGFVAQRAICESFRNPNDSQLLKIVDNVIDLNKTAGVDAHLAKILTNCHQNQSIYNVLNLRNVFDINQVDDYLEKYSIEDKLSELTATIDVNFDHFQILNSTAIEKLTNLGNSNIDDIEFYHFTNVVSYFFIHRMSLKIFTHYKFLT